MCGRMWVLEGVRVWMRVCGCMCVCECVCGYEYWRVCGRIYV